MLDKPILDFVRGTGPSVLVATLVMSGQGLYYTHKTNVNFCEKQNKLIYVIRLNDKCAQTFIKTRIVDCI